MITTEIVARREHRCYARRGCVIKPGETYTRQTLLPWEFIADDVDEDGRTIATRVGHYEHTTFHARCQMEADYGAQ